MRNLIKVLIMALLLAGVVDAQKRRPSRAVRKPAATTASVKAAANPGAIDFRTYTNDAFNFSVTFPNTWVIPDSDIESVLKSQGSDLSLKTPPGLSPLTKNTIVRRLKTVTVLLTAYKKMPDMPENAMVRISVEDLKAAPQVKDAVDYIDAIIQSYKTMQLPKGYKYSETQAEKLGRMQFAYLDSETPDDKRRMYATVRNGHALIFTITYTDKDDLEVLREMLSDGNFALNKRS